MLTVADAFGSPARVAGTLLVVGGTAFGAGGAAIATLVGLAPGLTPGRVLFMGILYVVGGIMLHPDVWAAYTLFEYPPVRAPMMTSLPVIAATAGFD